MGSQIGQKGLTYKIKGDHEEYQKIRAEHNKSVNS
jgi:hypothetical protein